MRSAIGHRRTDVPRWLLWLVAVVCFGPLLVVWWFGALLVPIWVVLLAAEIAQPERFAHEPPEALWSAASAIACVVGGGIGLAGLLRVLTVRERPRRHRVFTLGAVAVGLAALLLFEIPTLRGDLSDLRDGENIAGFLFSFGLPLIGTAWLLATSWRFLLASRGPESGQRPRIRREHFDDWRLDA